LKVAISNLILFSQGKNTSINQTKGYFSIYLSGIELVYY